MNFPKVLLAEIAEINPKGPTKGEFGPDDPVDFVPMAAVSESGDMEPDGQRAYSQVSKGYTAFKNGDILLAKITPCFENNKIAKARVSTPYAFGSTEFHVIRRNVALLDDSYLAHYLRQDHIRGAGERRMTGSGGQRRVPTAFLEELKIPLPPLEEQKRIAGILDQADALRRLRTRALDKLNTLGQAIFHEMFGDPVSNPMGWDKVKLGDLCGVGSSKRVFVSEFVEDGVPFYRGTEVGKLGDGECINPELFISQEHYQSLAELSGKPEIGDLLLPSICHDGRIWRVDSNLPFYFKDGRVLWIKSHAAEIDSEYLRNQLRNMFQHNYNSIASGTTFAELKIVNLKNLQILYPPLELQRKFSSRIEEVQRQQSTLNLSENALGNFFTSLQHRAFRGDL